MSKNVKFDSPAGSRSCRGHASRRTHDPGHGSSGHPPQEETVERLRERLTEALAEREDWKNKAIGLARTLDKMTIEKNNLQAHARALSAHIELLESEVRRADSEQADRAQRKANRGGGTPSPTTTQMSGGNPDAPKRRPSVSVSLHHKPRKDRDVERADREQEREQQKEKLKQRFSRNDESDRSGGSSTKTSRSRSNSYAEPMDPGGQRTPPSVPMSPTAVQQFSSYSTTQTYSPAIGPRRPEPYIGQVPRNVARNVVRYFADAPAAYEDQGYEDGNYMAHPLLTVSSLKGRR